MARSRLARCPHQTFMLSWKWMESLARLLSSRYDYGKSRLEALRCHWHVFINIEACVVSVAQSICVRFHWGSPLNTKIVLSVLNSVLQNVVLSVLNIKIVLSLNIESLWPSDAIWQHWSRFTLAQVMACCLTAPSLYMHQCSLTISKVQ